MKQTQTDWEEAYQRRETPWEKGKPHPGLVDFLSENGPMQGEIFVPGCGSGQDVRALSAPENHPVGVDLAPFAITKAKSRPAIANEEFLLADLFDLPPMFDRHFDWVFEHTCFCAIDPSLRQDYIATIVSCSSPTAACSRFFSSIPITPRTARPIASATPGLRNFSARISGSKRNGSRREPIPGVRGAS